MNVRIAVALSVLGLLLLASCGYTVTVTPLTQKAFAPSNVLDLEIFMQGTEVPNRLFDKLARIDVSKRATRGSFAGALEELKTAGARIGADALVDVSIHVAPEGTACPGCVTANAIAVKWR